MLSILALITLIWCKQLNSYYNYSSYKSLIIVFFCVQAQPTEGTPITPTGAATSLPSYAVILIVVAVLVVVIVALVLVVVILLVRRKPAVKKPRFVI